MKILFLSDDFPPESFGGAGKVAFDLARGLQKAGHQIFIITTVRERFDEGSIDYQGLKIFRIFSDYHEKWRAYLSLYNPQTAGKVKELIREIKPDIIHAQNIHYYLSYSCLKIAKKHSKAVFLTAHDVMLVHYGKWRSKFPNDYKITALDQIREVKKRYNPFRNLIIRYFLKYVDKIFAVSNSLKELLEANGIKNIKTIHNGINVADWQADNEEVKEFKQKYNLQNKRVILFGGRLSGLKGGEEIVKAVRGAARRIPSVVLLVAGEKEGFAKKMLLVSQELGVRDNLIFTGWLDGNEMRLAYHGCEIVTVPSIYLDPFPTVNLEAMACRKPVVGTCFGGIPEIVQNGITGYIVNPFNTDLMAAKIIDLLKNHQKAKQFGEAGYERVKKYFSLDSQVTKTIAWYQKMLGGKKRNPKNHRKFELLS